MTKNFYESLNELVMDSRFRNLAITQNFESFLNGQGINEAENMYTLRWFMAPKGSHGFNDTFLKEFVTNAWTMIHGQYETSFKGYKDSKFYTNFSPVTFQHCSFNNAFIDNEMTKEVPCADIVITDVASKLMVVINNKYDQAKCDKVVTYFKADKYNYFENKIFVSFDGEVQTSTGTQWMHMNNEWIINLCTNLIECPQYSNMKVTGQLKDFYQFLTGTQYGTSHQQFAESSATLISDYYEVITAFQKFKAEKFPTVSLIDINPRDYASLYLGKISEKEYGVLSLYWSYRNTFNTFFQLVELETVTRNLVKTTEDKPYRFDSTFIRNGLCFTPTFDKFGTDKVFMNTIFDVEMVWDMNKNLNVGLVVNKFSWDKLTHVQRNVIQKNFGFPCDLLKDRVMVWNTFYKQNWQNKDLCKEITAVFDKVNTYFESIGVRAA